MIRKCAMCKKEISDKEKIYTFATSDLTDALSRQKRIHYGRFCASCFSKLSLEEMDN